MAYKAMEENKPNGVPKTPSPRGTVGSEGKLSEGKRAYNSPKTSKEVLLKCRYDYERGAWTSLKELAERYGIDQRTLQGRITRERWDKQRQVILSKVEAKVEKEVLREVSEADSYLKASFKRAVRYEAIADASIAQAGTNADGIPLVDPDQLDQVTRSLIRLHELAKSSLRLPTVAMDITSNGQGLGDSFISAIAKLRQEANTPKLGNEDLTKVLEAEVE